MRPKHPMAGSPVELTAGPHKGKYFIVVDWLQNQYQGKSMEAIAKSHPELTRQVTSRKGFKLDDQIVFGKLYPALNFVCVHDSDMQIIEKKPPELTVISGGKDDSRGPSEGDNQASSTKGPESDGRTVSSEGSADESAERSAEEVQADKPVGRKSRKSTKATE